VSRENQWEALTKRTAMAKNGRWGGTGGTEVTSGTKEVKYRKPNSPEEDRAVQNRRERKKKGKQKEKVGAREIAVNLNGRK